MNRHWLRLTAIVAQREIRQRGRSRAFAVTTIVLLLVVAAGVTIPAIVAHNASRSGSAWWAARSPRPAGSSERQAD